MRDTPPTPPPATSAVPFAARTPYGAFGQGSPTLPEIADG